MRALRFVLLAFRLMLTGVPRETLLLSSLAQHQAILTIGGQEFFFSSTAEDNCDIMQGPETDNECCTAIACIKQKLSLQVCFISICIVVFKDWSVLPFASWVHGTPSSLSAEDLGCKHQEPSKN
jgi:hypothetical protein